MVMPNWNIEISDETDRIVKEFLAHSDGGERDLGKFVDQAVREALFHRTVRTVKERASAEDPDEVLHLIDQAVDETRASGT